MPKLTGIAVALGVEYPPNDTEYPLHIVASSSAAGTGAATVWHTWQLASGGEWNGWQPFGEPGPGDPGPPTMYQDGGTGQLGVLLVGFGGQAVWHRRQTGREPDKWSDWESLGQPGGHPIQGPVATALLRNGQIMAVVVAAGAVWQTTATEDPYEQWSAWSSFGQPDGAIVLAVSIATSIDGQCELVALVEWPDHGDTTSPGDRSVLWRRLNIHGGWSDWEPLRQPAGDSVPVGTPVLWWNSYRTGNLELFTRTSDGAVWRAVQQADNTGARGPWEMLVRPGYSFGDLAVATDSEGRMLLVAPTSAGNHLWYALQSAADWATWSPLSPLSVVPEASTQDADALTCPVLAIDGKNCMQLYVVGPATGDIYGFTADGPGQLPTNPLSFTHP